MKDMTAWSCFAFLFLSLVAITESQQDNCGCGVTAVRGFNPFKITGKWHGVKVKLPSFIRTIFFGDASWQIDFDPYSGEIPINIMGRSIIYPYNCSIVPVILTPNGPPGHYRWRSTGFISEADVVIADTDYRNYMVINLCIPRGNGRYEQSVMTFSRRNLFGDQNRVLRISNFLDRIITEKLCADPREFIFNIYSFQGVRDCPGNGYWQS